MYHQNKPFLGTVLIIFYFISLITTISYENKFVNVLHITTVFCTLYGLI